MSMKYSGPSLSRSQARLRLPDGAGWTATRGRRPSALASSTCGTGTFSRSAVVGLIRQQLAECRQTIANGGTPPTLAELVDTVRRQAVKAWQAWPQPVINATACRFLQEGKCRVCAKVCPADAIDYEQGDTFFEEEVGAIIVATGFDLYPLGKIGEYGSGRIPDVVDAFSRD